MRIRSRHRIAFTLLRATVPPTGEQIQLFENTLPQLCLSSGVYRTTYRGRFRDFDPLLNERMAAEFGSTAALRIEDWAASDCLASSEWAATLFPMFPNATLTASDLTLYLIEARVPDGSTYVMEANGELLQYIRPPFVIRLVPSESKLLLVNAVLERLARSRYRTLRQSWRLPAEWLNSECPETFEQPPFVFRKIPLIHPEAQQLRRSSGKFSIRRHSVFEPSIEPCGVIRTMNIFNHSYFSKERLLEGARAVARSLTEGGLWIVGRTMQENPAVHHVSLFIRQKNGFRLIERFGPGSEIEELVLTGLPA
jgi:hypothetical protein